MATRTRGRKAAAHDDDDHEDRPGLDVIVGIQVGVHQS